jgi:(S)-2-hydroxyglutarate dehydrogenase
MRVAIIGGGILGLATGRLIAQTRDDVEVVLLEKEDGLARHQTGHSSGVAHAGLYYAPGSLKATLCRRGLGLLREYCAAHGLGYEACGKVVVASTADEVEPLRRLADRAHANGVQGLRLLSEKELGEIEPCAAGVAGLHSPESAIVDFVQVSLSLADELRSHGAEIRVGTKVERVLVGSGGPELELDDGTTLRADRVVACAGLQSDRLAVASGEPAEPRIVPFRGEYWQLRPQLAGLAHGLIYPVPDPRLPFLGIHLTRKLDGSVYLGPNAVLARAREGYSARDFDWHDVYETLSWPGSWRMMRRHWRAGIGEIRRSASRRAFVEEARKLIPSLTAGDVARAPAGLRAQAVDRDGSLVDDFRLTVSRGVVWVRNAPSPAATSSLAIAEELAERALG